ncbi:hypothetical protein JKP88DRAFT_263974 [Tribonema minus]|uniref:Uncharacterized protein n=1 Tax=Tribonema minus TaxID=303371 RepID=A0A835YRL5_9STRA|nr:hypothetical protein JKP88DRAFT_263974 [Tribonema minus]
MNHQCMRQSLDTTAPTALPLRDDAKTTAWQLQRQTTGGSKAARASGHYTALRIPNSGNMVRKDKAWDVFGPLAKGMQAKQMSLISRNGSDILRAKTLKAEAEAKWEELQVDRGPQREVNLTIPIIEELLQQNVTLEQTATHSALFMDGDTQDPRPLYSSSGPSGRPQTRLLDMSTSVDPAAQGITVGMRLRGGEVVVDTSGLTTFKVAAASSAAAAAALARANGGSSPASHASNATRKATASSSPAPAATSRKASLPSTLPPTPAAGAPPRQPHAAPLNLNRYIADLDAIAAVLAEKPTGLILDYCRVFEKQWIRGEVNITGDVEQIGGGRPRNASKKQCAVEFSPLYKKDNHGTFQLLSDDPLAKRASTVEDDHSFYGMEARDDGEEVKLVGLTYVLRNSLDKADKGGRLTKAWQHLLYNAVALWHEGMQVFHMKLHNPDANVKSVHLRDFGSHSRAAGPDIISSEVRTGGIAQAALRRLKCGELLWAGMPHLYDKDIPQTSYLQACWPKFDWDIFNSMEAMTNPNAALQSNHNASSDTVKILFTATSINRIPHCSAVFIPLYQSEWDMIRPRLNSRMVAKHLPSALKDLLRGPFTDSVVLAQLEHLVKATQVGRTGDKETNGYSANTVSNMNSHACHMMDTVTFHVSDGDHRPEMYLERLRNSFTAYQLRIRSIQTEEQAEGQAFGKIQQDGRSPDALKSAALFKTMWINVEGGTWEVLRESLIKHLADRGARWESMMEEFYALLGGVRTAKAHGVEHLVTETGEQLAGDLIEEGYTTHDAASLEMYFNMKLASIVSRRNQDFLLNKASRVYAKLTDDGVWVLFVYMDRPMAKKTSHIRGRGEAGPLQIAIPVPKALADVLVVMLFILRRLRAVLHKAEPDDRVLGLSGANGKQVGKKTFTDAVAEIGAYHLGVPSLGVYVFRHETITTIMDLSRYLRSQNEHKAADTVEQDGARQLGTSVAAMRLAYDNNADAVTMAHDFRAMKDAAVISPSPQPAVEATASPAHAVGEPVFTVPSPPAPAVGEPPFTVPSPPTPAVGEPLASFTVSPPPSADYQQLDHDARARLHQLRYEAECKRLQREDDAHARKVRLETEALAVSLKRKPDMQLDEFRTKRRSTTVDMPIMQPQYTGMWWPHQAPQQQGAQSPQQQRAQSPQQQRAQSPQQQRAQSAQQQRAIHSPESQYTGMQQWPQQQQWPQRPVQQQWPQLPVQQQVQQHFPHMPVMRAAYTDTPAVAQQYPCVAAQAQHTGDDLVWPPMTHGQP